MKNRPVAVRLSTWFVAVLVALSPLPVVGAGISPPDAAAILQASRAALLVTRGVAYDFVYGDGDEPTGWVTGLTRMRRVTRVADSWLRVEGTFHAQPRFGSTAARFAYGNDGREVIAIDHTAGTYQEAAVADGANGLAWRAVYGYLPEFVEAAPFWKELEQATRLTVLGTETVDGELCDIVQAVFMAEDTTYLDLRWSIARSDRLPRRGRWITPGGRPDGLVMEARNLDIVTSASRDSFSLEPPAGYELADSPAVAGVGRPVPDLTLPRAGGGAVRLADHRGRVVVLDFWNTWCPMCRTVTPQTRNLAEAFAGRPVAFFGVNLFETGDPMPYWRAGGFSYPLLLEGEQLAAALDIPWQPGVAVIGTDGRVLYAQLGASHDRHERVRDAIRRGLADRVGRSPNDP